MKVLLVLFACVVVACATSTSEPPNICKLATHHQNYDLRLMSRDSDELTTQLLDGSKLFFNPCGPVPVSLCKDSSVCLVTRKGYAISYGRSVSALWNNVNFPQNDDNDDKDEGKDDDETDFHENGHPHGDHDDSDHGGPEPVEAQQAERAEVLALKPASAPEDPALLDIKDPNPMLDLEQPDQTNPLLDLAPGGTTIGSEPCGPVEFEVTYGAGELCGNDVPRKTLVQFVCSLESDGPGVIAMQTEDECMLSFTVVSPYACEVPDYCEAQDEQGCADSEGLCRLSPDGQCEADSDCWDWQGHRVRGMAVVGLISSMAFLVTCGLSLCCCACCARRRRLARRRKLPTRMPKKVKALPKKKPTTPATPYAYHPLTQQFPQNPPPFVFYPAESYPMVPMTPSTQQQ